MKIKVWLDSGANHFSKREEVYDLEDLGLSEEEWKNMSEESKEEMMKDIAFNTLDWGFKEI